MIGNKRLRLHLLNEPPLLDYPLGCDTKGSQLIHQALFAKLLRSKLTAAYFIPLAFAVSY